MQLICWSITGTKAHRPQILWCIQYPKMLSTKKNTKYEKNENIQTSIFEYVYLIMYTCILNYVYLQDNYVNMQDMYVYMYTWLYIHARYLCIHAR